MQSLMFKVPLDPKGRFHSEAEKESSKLYCGIGVWRQFELHHLIE